MTKFKMVGESRTLFLVLEDGYYYWEDIPKRINVDGAYPFSSILLQWRKNGYDIYWINDEI